MLLGDPQEVPIKREAEASRKVDGSEEGEGGKKEEKKEKRTFAWENLSEGGNSFLSNQEELKVSRSFQIGRSHKKRPGFWVKKSANEVAKKSFIEGDHEGNCLVEMRRNEEGGKRSNTEVEHERTQQALVNAVKPLVKL